jgi:hypothetical protein
MLFEEGQNVVGFRNLSVAVCITQLADEFVGCFNADIVAYERFLELVEQIVIYISAESQYSGKRRADFVPCFAEPLF